jgi:hypothetical protein
MADYAWSTEASPQSPLHPGIDEPALRERYDGQSCRAGRGQHGRPSAERDDLSRQSCRAALCVPLLQRCKRLVVELVDDMANALGASNHSRLLVGPGGRRMVRRAPSVYRGQLAAPTSAD